MTTSFIQPEVRKIQAIFAEPNLEIPDYQRPYKWQHHHVLQLLQDLQHHYQKQQVYRLGTVVIHHHENQHNIVDGQQRLITLSLLLAHLEHKPAFLQQTFSHSTTCHNIQSNYLFIQRYLEESNLDKTTFRDYILEQCELVWVCLNNLEEAFQFFDSQNARGKPLEPYDLLKAYHLRELPSDHPKLMRHVENWERAVNEDPTLRVIISQVLFRLRQWQRYRDAETFQNRDLPLFKGVSERDDYPYLQAQRAGMALHQAKILNPMLYDGLYTTPPFQVSQTIINGNLFFEFVEHYRQKYQALFDERTGLLSRIKIQEQSYLQALKYEGHTRTGDRYIYNLFKCAVLMYYDKFGKAGLEIALNRALHWAYRLRLQYTRVMWGRVETEAQDRNGLLHCIALAEHPADVAAFSTEKIKVEYQVEALKKLLGY